MSNIFDDFDLDIQKITGTSDIVAASITSLTGDSSLCSLTFNPCSSNVAKTAGCDTWDCPKPTDGCPSPTNTGCQTANPPCGVIMKI